MARKAKHLWFDAQSQARKAASGWQQRGYRCSITAVDDGYVLIIHTR